MTDLKTKISRLKETHTQVANEAAHLQAFVDEFCEEATPLQEDNNSVFDAY